jgi:phosphoribosyl-ATP pyrophosphohydrolase
MAAEYQQDSELALEISQLLYHCAVIAVARGIDLNQIYENL